MQHTLYCTSTSNIAQISRGNGSNYGKLKPNKLQQLNSFNGRKKIPHRPAAGADRKTSFKAAYGFLAVIS